MKPPDDGTCHKYFRLSTIKEFVYCLSVPQRVGLLGKAAQRTPRQGGRKVSTCRVN